MLSSLLGKAANTFAQYRDKDTAEAVVASMLYVSSVDGDIGASETTKINQIINNLPLLKQFDPGILQAKRDELLSQFAIDASEGRAACVTEIREAARKADYEKRKTIVRMAIVVAKDGGIDDKEKAALRFIASLLSVDAGEFAELAA